MPKDITASEFIRSQPQSMPTRNVVDAGAKHGLKFSANLVYKIRSERSPGRVARGLPPAPRPTTSSNVDSEIRSRIDRFLTEIGELARECVVEAVRAQLEPGGAVRVGRLRARPRKGAKRLPGQIAKTTLALMAAIRTNPGLRIEQLSEKLGVSTKGLALPARKLIAEKKIRTTGTRRATKYFVR